MSGFTPRQTRLAVLGSPIAHSQSPALHAAAYRLLGQPWSYERVELSADKLQGFLAGASDEWRGLSLTMPLKERALQLADQVDDAAQLTGAANTIAFDTGDTPAPVGQTGRLLAFNTDVAGLTNAITDAGVPAVGHVWILGAGATARSALVAAAGLGATAVSIIARHVERALPLVALGERLGVPVERHSTVDSVAAPDLVISTLPGGANVPWQFPASVARHAVLFDVAYDPWPSQLARVWSDGGGRAISGIDMLIHQALVQVRIFTSGDPEAPLPHEHEVLKAMRAAVGRGE